MTARHIQRRTQGHTSWGRHSHAGRRCSLCCRSPHGKNPTPLHRLSAGKRPQQRLVSTHALLGRSRPRKTLATHSFREVCPGRRLTERCARLHSPRTLGQAARRRKERRDSRKGKARPHEQPQPCHKHKHTPQRWGAHRPEQTQLKERKTLQQGKNTAAGPHKNTWHG
jgi:hypothetical protein